MGNTGDLTDTMAEGGVIATLIYHPEFLLSENILKPGFFSKTDNKCFFWAIEKLVASGVDNVDVVNLGNTLNSDLKIKHAMEQYSISSLQSYIDMAKNAARGTYEEYRLLAENVVTCAFRRELEAFAVSVGKECHNRELSLDDLNDYVTGGITRMAERFIFGGDSVLFGEKIDDVWAAIENKRNDDGTYGLPSKVDSLNDYITYGDGELTLIAGSTGKGKSAFFLNEGMYAVQRGVTTMIIDTELTDEVFLPRALANISGVPVRKIRSGTYTNEECKRVLAAKDWLKMQPFIHQYDPVFQKSKVEQMAWKWKNQKNLGLLIYDYIKPSERFGAADISQSLGIMTDFLKNTIAGGIGIPVIAGLQLNKQTGIVADSMKPERYADTLIYWKEKTVEELRKDSMACGNYKLEVVKNRNGATTGEDEYIDIMFQGDLMRVSAAKKHNGDGETDFEDVPEGERVFNN